jgi:hypothetical protein
MADKVRLIYRPDFTSRSSIICRVLPIKQGVTENLKQPRRDCEDSLKGAGGRRLRGNNHLSAKESCSGKSRKRVHECEDGRPDGINACLSCNVINEGIVEVEERITWNVSSSIPSYIEQMVKVKRMSIMIQLASAILSARTQILGKVQ